VKDGAFVHFVVSMERNDDRSFEDRKRILEKIKSLFFNTSHLWTAAFVSPFVISYHDFSCSFCSIS
jgi:hypothetical protein